MPHNRLPVPEAPINDRLLATLIELFEKDPDATVTEAEASLMFQAAPGCLRELLTYRRLLARQYDDLWVEGALASSSNVVRLPDNRDRRPDPRETV
jgi:hypothetical protein